MKMRPSRILRKLRAGQPAVTFKLNFADTRVADLAARYGFDCIWLDMEHTASDYSVIEAQILAAKCHDVDAMVRVCRGSYSDYVRPLELDASGIMVPHVMSLEDARRVVHMTRFPPVGRRAVDGGNADGAYCGMPFLEYLRVSNEERFIALQIEDPEPLQELDAIAALEGYDILFFGPGDFSCAIGAPAQFDHPKVVEAKRRIAECANRHGKAAGTIGAVESLPDLLALGYRFVNVGADVVGLGNYCASLARTVQKTINPT